MKHGCTCRQQSPIKTKNFKVLHFDLPQIRIIWCHWLRCEHWASLVNVSLCKLSKIPKPQSEYTEITISLRYSQWNILLKHVSTANNLALHIGNNNSQDVVTPFSIHYLPQSSFRQSEYKPEVSMSTFTFIVYKIHPGKWTSYKVWY